MAAGVVALRSAAAVAQAQAPAAEVPVPAAARAAAAVRAATKLRVRLSAPGSIRVSIRRLSRHGSLGQARTVRRAARSVHALRLAARGMRAGRYRIAVVASDPAGRASKSKKINLRVR